MLIAILRPMTARRMWRLRSQLGPMTLSWHGSCSTAHFHLGKWAAILCSAHRHHPLQESARLLLPDGEELTPDQPHRCCAGGESGHHRLLLGRDGKVSSLPLPLAPSDESRIHFLFCRVEAFGRSVLFKPPETMGGKDMTFALVLDCSSVGIAKIILRY